MLQNNNTLARNMRLCDLMNQPADQVIEYLKGQPECIGEAVAKMCYQTITRQGGTNESITH